MVAEDDQVVHVGDRRSGLLCDLRDGAVLVQARHRGEPLRPESLGLRRSDHAVGVAGVANNGHPAVVRGNLVDRPTLFDEDLAVLPKQVCALHARAAWLGADEQTPVGVLERHRGVVGEHQAVQQRERTVVELHRHAPHGLLRAFDRDLEQLQDDGLIGAEHLAGGNAGKQAVADLAGSTGDGNANRVLHSVLWGRAGGGLRLSRRAS